MRRQIALLVAATTSAVVLAFVIPLGLLVQSLAEDRAMASANEEARNIAVLVSGLHGDPQLPDLVAAVDQRSSPSTSVLTSGGEVLGTAAPGLAEDPRVALARDGQAFTEVDADGGEILVPVVTTDGTDVVRTTVGPELLHAGVTTAWVAIGILGLVLCIAAVAIADRLGRRVSTPVTDLAAVAHRLREGDLDARAVPAGPPETTELGHALNRLAARITELLAAERAVVGDLSHRLRTPLTALRLDAEAVTHAVVAERLQRHIGQLQRTVDAIVRDARRPVRSDMQSVCDAVGVVRDRVSFWSALADDQGRRVQTQLPGGPTWVLLDARDLRDVVDVLVDNVFAHTPEGTSLSVRLTTRDDTAVLEVADEGPGIAARDEEAAQRTGFSGLGLQIVRRTVRAAGGELRVDSSPERGTRVEVQLPRASGTGAGLHRPQSSSVD